jgi:hypothetical protein
MKKFITTILLISLMVCFSRGATGLAGETIPKIYGSSSVLGKVGAVFNVPIYMSEVNNAYALGFDVIFDSDMIKLTSVNYGGSFMGSTDNTLFFDGSNIPGKVLIGISKYGKNVGSVKGKGLLFTLNFEALVLGSTKIDFSYCKLYELVNKNEINCDFSPVEIVIAGASGVRNSEDSITLILTIGKSTMSVGEKIGLKVGASPVISGGMTYVPIRAIIEELGGSVEWIASTKNVIINLDGKEISMFIDKSIAYLDGTPVVIDSNNALVYPKLIKGTTMVPLRFTAEILGMEVGWDAKLKTITLTYTRS